MSADPVSWRAVPTGCSKAAHLPHWGLRGPLWSEKCKGKTKRKENKPKRAVLSLQALGFLSDPAAACFSSSKSGP